MGKIVLLKYEFYNLKLQIPIIFYFKG